MIKLLSLALDAMEAVYVVSIGEEALGMVLLL